MSLPKPDVHITFDPDAFYFLELLAEAEGVKPGALATRIITEYVRVRGERLVSVATRLAQDNKLKGISELKEPK